MEPKKATEIRGLHLYENEWVAIAQDSKVADHNPKLSELHKKLGESAKQYSYLFIPSSRVGYIGPCLK